MQKANPNLTNTHTNIKCKCGYYTDTLMDLFFCSLHVYGNSDLVFCDHFMMWQQLYRVGYEISAGMKWVL